MDKKRFFWILKENPSYVQDGANGSSVGTGDSLLLRNYVYLLRKTVAFCFEVTVLIRGQRLYS